MSDEERAKLVGKITDYINENESAMNEFRRCISGRLNILGYEILTESLEFHMNPPQPFVGWVYARYVQQVRHMKLTPQRIGK